MAKYPSYSEYFRIKEEETWPGRASEYGFDLNWTAGVQSECFQVGHNLKYGATNPMYGYVQGEPPTKSSYKMSGMLMRGLNPQDPSARPSGQHQFELSGDGDVNAQNVFFIGNNMTLRGSMAKEKSGTSLLKDADLKYATGAFWEVLVLSQETL